VISATSARGALCMFPISSKQPLSFLEIASYWRREITPSASFDEVFNLLARAWWRGDLVAAGVNRTDLLRTLYQLDPDRIVFAVSGLPEPPLTEELPDGSVMVALWRVPLPNTISRIVTRDAGRYCSRRCRQRTYWDRRALRPPANQSATSMACKRRNLDRAIYSAHR
jgi:hypothetical protein